MEDQRICIKFCVKNGFKGAEIFWMLQTGYGDAVMSRKRVFEWYKRFKEGREETADNERSGRSSTSTTPEKVDKVLKLVREDRRITVREVAEEAGISFGSTQSIMKDILGVRRLNAVLVPKDLTFDQKNARKETASLNLEATTDDPELLKRVITGDETWIYGFDSETTQQASEWRFKNEPRPKKARKAPSKVKVVLTVFFDYQGIVHHEFQQQSSTITADSYLGILRRLREVISDSGVGAAIIFHSQEHQPVLLRLHPDCNVFQAELLAILWAAQITETSPTKTAVTIASDCRSALAAICSSGPTRTSLVANIIKVLNKDPYIKLCWVTGHTGIDENELADSAAKNSATSVLQPSYSILIRNHARNLTHKAALSSWTVLYSQDHSTRSLRRIAATPSHLLKFLPKISHGEAPTTILTGHVLADITRVHPETDPTCIHCSEEPQTVDHLLFSCTGFLRHRMQTAILLELTQLNLASMASLPDSTST
ncbi:hypothetical protein LAZ67_10001333 [Cordylochernes scorpioides]|uniref:RNase H type-1 domain-containing protein n=1 Tax=Cordylochernes scorpioides TaxID=51811 RepID=A0ABY6KVR9_9ARAC|nr:hypothetical protein LAZ67_10001333 [Cordylochernes scorpioides]